jgi:hypothetical protein
MMRLGGPVIRNFIHSETQDGKSLLDAHFAHATALIKRYLRRVRDNRLNQVTSAFELVEALCSLGGLQNCGAQLVTFDKDVSNKLAALAIRLKAAADKMKDYFARANEINYFPEEDLEGGNKFQIHVTAYSGVGKGARFEVDLDNGTVSLLSAVNGFDGVDVLEGVMTDEDVENDAWIGAEDAIHAFGSIVEDEDDVSVVVDELYLDSAVDDFGAAEDEKALKSTNGLTCYSSLNMVTGVKVEKCMGLGNVHTATRSSGRRGSSGQDVEAIDGITTRKNLVVKAILCLRKESFPAFGIMDGQDGDVDDYKIAKDFETPEEFVKGQGWARRPRKGVMYGAKYTERYKDELFVLFKRGSQDSDKKLGPSNMLEKLREAHPDVYTLPNFSEIQSFVSQCFSREKDGNSEEPIPSCTTSQGRRRGNRAEDSNDEMEQEISEIVQSFGGQIQPKYVLMRLRDQFSTAAVDSQKNKLQKIITKKRSEVLKEKLRTLIG